MTSLKVSDVTYVQGPNKRTAAFSCLPIGRLMYGLSRIDRSPQFSAHSRESRRYVRPPGRVNDIGNGRTKSSTVGTVLLFKPIIGVEI